MDVGPGRGRVAALVIAVVLALAGAVVPDDSAHADVGRVRGAIVGSHGDSPKVQVAWFTDQWSYLGKTKARGGGYSLALAPGVYHLQFTDLAPAYDVGKYAPSDVKVTVTSGSTTIKNVRLHVGASIGGTAYAGKTIAKGARIVAANADRTSYETTADKSGRYALGGLPPGTYSVFTYDKHRQWVGKSVFLRKLKAGKFRTVNPRLTTHAGRFIVDLYAGGDPYPGAAFVTAVSRKNGQFWTAKAKDGSVSFQGLYPGKYDVVVPGTGAYLGGTLHASGKVKPGRTGFGSVRLTKLGATITGTVVDAADGHTPLGSVQVQVYSASGGLLAQTTTDTAGAFTAGGQLTTTAGLTVVAQPGGTNPPYLQGAHYCKFGSVTLGSVAVTTGQATSLGAVTLPHLPASQQDDANQC